MNKINQHAFDIEGSDDAQLESQNHRSANVGKLITANLRVVLPLLLILLTAIIVTAFIVLQPEAPAKRPNLTPPLTVSVVDVEARNFQVNVQSYGTVAPRTQSFLISQVSGLVTEVGDSLREGSFFNKGDVLLRIDNRDYLADLKISQANLADARQALSQELAQSQQAELDWNRLGNAESASDLVLRKPQQQAARARMASAEAAVSKAQLGLDRTEITAPFDGRVLNKMVDLGQVTGNNAQVAEVYATDTIEIRLPLRNSDLQFVNLPEAYRGVGTAPKGTSVKVFSSLSEGDKPWLGNIVRTESAIDVSARQLHVVAQVDDPFGAAAVGRTPLKIGEYVTAEIQGKAIPNAIVIPASAIYQDTYVYVVEDGVVVRRNIDLLWQSANNALIGSGLNDGDRLVTTTLGQVASGTRVAIEGEAKSQRQRRGADTVNKGTGTVNENADRSDGSANAKGQRPEGERRRPTQATPDSSRN